MKKTILTILVLVLFASCQSFVKERIVFVSRPALTVHDTVTLMAFDSVPQEFTDNNFWKWYWNNNSMFALGVTFCYGENSAISQMSPTVPDSLYDIVYRHEMVHQDQAHILGCNKMVAMDQTPEGLFTLEYDAIINGEHRDSATAQARLLDYYQIRALGKDSIDKLIHNFKSPTRK